MINRELFDVEVTVRHRISPSSQLYTRILPVQHTTSSSTPHNLNHPMSSNTTDNQVQKRSVSFASDTTSRTSSMFVSTLYAGNPPSDYHNLKRELTTSFKDSYKSLSQPKLESISHSKHQPISKADLEAAIDGSSKENPVDDDKDVEDGGRKERSALNEAGIWASKFFNHSMATRGLH